MWGLLIREGRKGSSSSPWNLNLIRNMGGGPRTFPDGVSKWKWKRMHEKRAKDKQKKLLEQEKQVYQGRIRSLIRSTLSPSSSSSSSSSSTHNPISPRQHLKALADRFMKDGAQDLWNDSDGPLTPIEAQDQPQAQIEAQPSPQIDLRKLAHQPSNRNLNNFSQIRGFRSVPDVSDLSDRKRDLSDRKRVGTEKKRIWRKNDSSSDDESEDEVESQNQGYNSNVGSIASLGKYDVKRERRVMPKKFDDGTDFSEQVQLIKYEIHKKKLSQNRENQSEEQENILSKTRFDECAISPLTIKALSSSGYIHMTRVQETSLPVCLEDVDVMVKAKTGTGKTAAFLLPVFTLSPRALSSLCLSLLTLSRSKLRYRKHERKKQSLSNTLSLHSVFPRSLFTLSRSKLSSMPKVRDWSLSYPYWDGCGRYPYPPIDFDPPRPRLASVDEMKEWDDTKCPICMEIPHNTVVLKCSSYDKGCRPYMCNTSSRHSNCLDQFCRSFDSSLSSSKLEEIPLVATTASNSSQCGNRLQPKLTCPLCRGGIYGYMVSETARRYMNSKLRSCSSETCEFQGTYPELRKHARVEHPTVRPTEVDPSRQGDWERMEQQRELEDVISSMNERYSAENSGEDTILSGSMHDLMSLVAYQLLTVEEGASLISSLWSDPTPRPRMSLHDRRYETVHRVSNVTQTNQSARWRSGLPSTHHHRRIHRAGSRINPSSSHDPEGAILMSSLWSDPTPRPRMSLHDRRYETVHRVSNVTQTNQSARWRSGLPSTHHHRRIGSRINPSSSHDPEGARLMSSLWSDPTPRPRNE